MFRRIISLMLITALIASVPQCAFAVTAGDALFGNATVETTPEPAYMGQYADESADIDDATASASDYIELKIGDRDTAGDVAYVLYLQLRLIELGYLSGSADGAYLCSIAWQGLEAELTIEDVQTLAAESYPTATLTEVNGISMVYYLDEANDALNFLALDAAEPGYYMFVFTPGSDADYQVVAALIASTIRNI